MFSAFVVMATKNGLVVDSNLGTGVGHKKCLLQSSKLLFSLHLWGAMSLKEMKENKIYKNDRLPNEKREKVET